MEVEDVVDALTPVVSGVVQVFHELLVELRLLLVAEVEEGDRQAACWCTRRSNFPCCDTVIHLTRFS